MTYIQEANSILSPNTAFGEISVTEFTPKAVIKAPYGVNSFVIETILNDSGGVSASNGMISISTGASATSYAAVKSNDVVRYSLGQGVLTRFTAIFTDGVANSTQYIGIGDERDGYFFGYSGTQFGILRRSKGKFETRTLTVTVASSHSENITVTLDGVSEPVTVTNSGVISTTVNEIAAHSFANVGNGWEAIPMGNTVIFKAYDAAPHSGIFSISGTSAAGTFAQSVVGVVPSEEFIAQADWNVDKCDGSQVMPKMYTNVGNVYQIQFQWLGFGQITFSIENPNTGRFQIVHELRYANLHTETSILQPVLRLYAGVYNSTNNTNVILKTPSMSSGIEGKDELIGPRRGIMRSKGSITTAEVPIMSIINHPVFNSTNNKARIKLLKVSIGNDHTKTMLFRFYLNTKLTGASWAAVGAGTSPVYVDNTATAFSGGTFLFGSLVGAANTVILDLEIDQLMGIFAPGDKLTITGEAVSGTGATGVASLYWVELD